MSLDNKGGQNADKTTGYSLATIENKPFALPTKRSAKPLCVGSIPTRASNFSTT